jgi:hypothetical protein
MTTLEARRSQFRQAIHLAWWRWRTRNQPEPPLNAWGSPDLGYW